MLTNPLSRPQRDTHLASYRPSPLTRQKPRRDHSTLNRIQPILTTNPLTHKPSNRREHTHRVAPIG